MRRVLAGSALVALVLGAAPAAASAGAPPERLWRDFPLTTRTEAPPVVPQVAPVEDEAQRPVGARRGDDGESAGVWVAAAGGAVVLLSGGALLGRRRRGRAPGRPPVAASVPALAPPDRRVVALDRTRIVRRGPVREVVAAVAPPTGGPVYEIEWHSDGEGSAFVLALCGEGAGVPDAPRSRLTAWRVAGSPPAVASLRAIHEEFCAALADAGWIAVGRGEAWYSRRFRARVPAPDRQARFASNLRPEA